MSEPSSSFVPAVGRAVHYRSLGSADGKYRPLCRAATITETFTSPLRVSLAVLSPTGLFFDQSVARGDSLEPGTWHVPGHNGRCDRSVQHPALMGE